MASSNFSSRARWSGCAYAAVSCFADGRFAGFNGHQPGFQVLPAFLDHHPPRLRTADGSVLVLEEVQGLGRGQRRILSSVRNPHVTNLSFGEIAVTADFACSSRQPAATGSSTISRFTRRLFRHRQRGAFLHSRSWRSRSACSAARLRSASMASDDDHARHVLRVRIPHASPVPRHQPAALHPVRAVLRPSFGLGACFSLFCCDACVRQLHVLLAPWLQLRGVRVQPPRQSGARVLPFHSRRAASSRRQASSACSAFVLLAVGEVHAKNGNGFIFCLASLGGKLF